MPSFARGHLLICLPPSPVFRNSLDDSGAFVSGHHFGKARLHSVPKKRPTITSPPSDTRPGRVGDPSPQSWRCTSVDARAYIFVLAPTLQLPDYGGLGEASGTQPRGSHQLGADGGGYGCVSALGAQPEAAVILLGVDFDNCDPALHY